MQAVDTKRWEFHDPVNEEAVAELQESLGVDQILASLLLQRGITNFEEAKTFFRPSLEQLHDPYLMKDMEKAVSRIVEALEEEQNILVYGDYDVDGTTAVALVYSFLKRHHNNIDFYIPDRYLEGYGVSDQGIDYAIEGKFSLIIALDCGIKAIDKVSRARENGVDFIICDHHRPGSELPPAVAILDPKQDDCTYPFDELCGCGIGFKLMHALTEKLELDEEQLLENLDLTAISACSDIVPLVGENRVLTWFGLQQINDKPRIGIQSMLQLANQDKTITVHEVVFTIGPRINAAGRMHTGRKAVELLISEDAKSANLIGQDIQLNNAQRQDLDKQITAEALQMIASDPGYDDRKTTVVFKEDWHKGVVGIVASRLIEKHYRPTIVLTKSNGKITGSARSVHGFDVYNAINECSDLLEQFGGHMYAAGLTMLEENVERFKDRFDEVVSKQISPDLLVPQITINAEMDLEDITPKFFRVLKQFEPFGPQNMRPVFVSKGLQDTGWAKIVGSDHLKFAVESQSGERFGAIAFGHGDKLSLIQGGKFDVAYTLEENHWNGTTSIQLNVKDIRSAEA